MFSFFSSKKDPFQVRKEYNIPTKVQLSIQITPDGWFLVTSPELPGLITQARNAKELLEMVNDAILTYFDVPKKEADEIFNFVNIDGYGSISRKDEKVLVAN